MKDGYYIVRVSSAPVKGKARKFGGYIRVGVLRVDEGVKAVPAIDERLRVVQGISATWGFRRALHCGKTERSEGRKAIAEAERMAERLNRWERARRLAAFDPAI